MAGRIASGVPASIDRRTALLGAVAALGAPTTSGARAASRQFGDKHADTRLTVMGASEADTLAALYAEARALQAEAERTVSDPAEVARSADLLADLERRALDVRVTTPAGAAAALEWVRADLLPSIGRLGYPRAARRVEDRMPKLMTAEEYRAALAALGLTQNAGAELVGVDGRTSRRWANAERDIPPPAARFLRYLMHVGADPAKVGAILDGIEKKTSSRGNVEA